MASRGKTNPDDFTASCRVGGELQEERSTGPPPLPRRDVKLASFSIICAGNSEPPRGALLFPRSIRRANMWAAAHFRRRPVDSCRLFTSSQWTGLLKPRLPEAPFLRRVHRQQLWSLLMLFYLTYLFCEIESSGEVGGSSTLRLCDTTGYENLQGRRCRLLLPAFWTENVLAIPSCCHTLTVENVLIDKINNNHRQSFISYLNFFPSFMLTAGVDVEEKLSK